MRFSRMMERVEGVSQKSLTKVLRQLARCAGDARHVCRGASEG
jgi:DNA-binding HxlR family transcriptional regulator